jgi:hypothetical protein
MLSPDFATTLLMPALSASFMSCSQSLAVNMIIRIRGAVAAISRATSSPSMPGIDRSRTTTSGFSSRTMSSATLPFSASPQTCQLVFISMQDRAASRIASLSSTTRIRSGIVLGTPFREAQVHSPEGVHLARRNEQPAEYNVVEGMRWNGCPSRSFTRSDGMKNYRQPWG